MMQDLQNKAVCVFCFLLTMFGCLALPLSGDECILLPCEKKHIYGDTSIIIKVNPGETDFEISISVFNKEKLKAKFEGVTFERLFPSPKNDYFLGVSNSGIPGTAFVDAALLTTLFHPDMVWPWPRTFQSHDPLDWIFVLGRFNRERWMKKWQELFASHDPAHNKRKIKKIVISEEKDGAFAVVDIETLWVEKASGKPNHWQGRACKVYARIGDEWKMTMHTGVLEY